MHLREYLRERGTFAGAGDEVGVPMWHRGPYGRRSPAQNVFPNPSEVGEKPGVVKAEQGTTPLQTLSPPQADSGTGVVGFPRSIM